MFLYPRGLLNPGQGRVYTLNKSQLSRFVYSPIHITVASTPILAQCDANIFNLVNYHPTQPPSNWYYSSYGTEINSNNLAWPQSPNPKLTNYKGPQRKCPSTSRGIRKYVGKVSEENQQLPYQPRFVPCQNKRLHGVFRSIMLQIREPKL